MFNGKLKNKKIDNSIDEPLNPIEDYEDYDDASVCGECINYNWMNKTCDILLTPTSEYDYVCKKYFKSIY